MSSSVTLSSDPKLTFHYLPREICILVRTGGPPDVSKAMDINRDLMARLNSVLQASLANVLPSRGDPIDRDSAPSPSIWQRCALKQDDPLRELARWPADRRFVLLDSADNSTDQLHFFAVEVNPKDPATFDEQDRASAIHDLVNLINNNFRPFPTVPPGGFAPAWEIRAATPNWLSNLSGLTDGGNPGAPPEPVTVPPRSETFHFGSVTLEGLVAAQRAAASTPADVVVAVLDTSPSNGVVQNASHTFGKNPLMGAVADPHTGVRVDGKLSLLHSALQEPDFMHVADYVPNWMGLLGPWQTTGIGSVGRYTMPDHGLFVAGIIKDIAPRAEVHLIRVLDSVGMGDMFALTFALSMLPARLVPGPSGPRRLIVNLSLSLDIPSPDQLMRLWFPLRFGGQQPPLVTPEEQTRINAVLVDIESSFKAVIDWLLAKGHLIVAAVGNDALGAPAPPPPRLPAGYAGVLSVGAVNNAGVASAFSNMVTATGVAVLGGDADINAGRGEVEIKRDARTGFPDAVVGIFTSATLPFGAGPNILGWAFWAGTSFATPIISALAAVLCMPAPLTNAQVIAQIQAFAAIPTPTLGGPGAINAIQV